MPRNISEYEFPGTKKNRTKDLRIWSNRAKRPTVRFASFSNYSCGRQRRSCRGRAEGFKPQCLTWTTIIAPVPADSHGIARFLGCSSSDVQKAETHPLAFCKYVHLGAQFCLIYLFLFSTCFGHPCARNQEKLLYLCDPGICHSVWVASGLLVAFQSNPQTGRHPYRVTNTSVAQIQ